MGVDDFDESTPPPKEPMSLDEANKVLDCENRIARLEEAVGRLSTKLSVLKFQYDNLATFIRILRLKDPPVSNDEE